MDVPNSKEIDRQERCLWWIKVNFVKWCEEEEKCEENGAIFRNKYLMNYWADFQYVELHIWRE